MALVSKNFGDIITFTRASTATYFDATGTLQSAAIDAPRFDYDPSTLAARGFLIEEARTNLITSSAVLPTPGVNVTITSDAFAAPDGTTTGDEILDNAVLSEHYTDSSFTPTAATNYTFSAFIRAIGANTSPFACLRLAGNVSAFVFINLSTFAITTGGAGFVSASIQPINGGWYRVSVTGLSAGTASSVARVQVTNAASLSAYSGTGQGFAIWGRQLEAGAFPTSYIPTTTTALTRSADVASVNTLSPWYNATEGTLFAEGILVGGTAATFPNQIGLVGANANTDNIRFAWNANSGTVGFGVRVSNTAQAGINTGPNKSAGSSYKIAGRYAVNNFQAAVDGALGTPDTSGTLPTITSLLLGGVATFQPAGNLWLRRATFYPRALADAELQALTA